MGYAAPVSVRASSERSVGFVAVCLAASSWGTWPLFVHYGGQSGLVAGFITMLVMALPAAVIAPRLRFDDRGAVAAVILIGVADAANVVLYFSALEAGPVVTAVLTHYLAPILVTLAAPLLLGERRSRRALLALPVMVVGLFLVLPPASQAGPGLRAGLLGGASAFCYTALVLATRRAAVSFPPLAVTSLHAVVSAGLLLIVFQSRALPEAVDGRLALFALGALVNGLGGAFLFNFGLPKIGAQLTGVLTYVEPLVASIIGFTVLDDRLTVAAVVGLAMMLTSGGWIALEPERSAR
jgi:drug/metabolite transporter (DMT)-like permease